MYKAVKIVAIVIVTIIILIWTIGIRLSTTHLAFVSDGGPLRVPGYVRVQMTPLKHPTEAIWIWLATLARIPVQVSVPFEGSTISFKIRKGNGGDMLIPCKEENQCCRVLAALKYECNAK